MSKSFILRNDTVKQYALNYLSNLPTSEDHPLVIRVGELTRTLEANAAMWAMLGEVSDQVDWHGNKLTPEEWKDVFSAALSKQKVVPGIDNGFVVMGQHTSRMTKREMSDLLELISAFGAEHGVEFNVKDNS